MEEIQVCTSYVLLGSLSEMARGKLPCMTKHATDPSYRVLSVQGFKAAG